MTAMTGGEAIVQSLLTHGVDTLFGLPGVQNDWLYNALYDQRVIAAASRRGVTREQLKLPPRDLLLIFEGTESAAGTRG